MTDVVIVEAVRSPLGRRSGGLSTMHPADLLGTVQRDLNEIICESIEYGLIHRDEAVAYSLAFARDMNQQLASRFIGMYVNEFTRDYGATGRAAIRRFLADAHEKKYINVPIEIEFVE